MKFFTKSELISIAIIFFVLAVVSIPNFLVSLRRARDQVRKDDMGVLLKVLDEYSSDFRIYPLSSPDGRIMACKKPGDKVTKDINGRLVVNFIPCDWGVNAITDVTQEGGRVYMPLLPRDPDYQKGTAYLYISDGTRFQIYVALEGKDEAEYDPKIIARNLMCGNQVCNAGRASGDTPTNISISEYEAKLMGK